LKIDEEILGVCGSEICQWVGGTGPKSKKWLENFAATHGLPGPWAPGGEPKDIEPPKDN
jgi:hypothetical protein